MKKSFRKPLALLLSLAMVISLFAGMSIDVSAAYGSSGDIHKYYFTLDRIPGNGGFPGQALDRTVTVSDLRDKDGDSFGNDMWEDLSYYTVDVKRNGVSTSDTIIQPDSIYTYIVHVYCDDDYDVVYYGYNSSTEVWWNGQKYSTTYDAGNSGTSGYTWSRFGFTTPKTASTYSKANVVENVLTYNGAEQRLLKDDQTKSSNRVTISYKVDNGEWLTDVSKVTAKNAGTHIIEWKVEGEGLNSQLTNSGTMYKEIKKLKATVTPVDDQSKIYGQLDPTFKYSIVATNGALTVPAVDLNTAGLLKNGALSRVAGENYKKEGYKYTIGTLQTANEVNYDLTFVDNTTVFMINRKNITEGGVDITLPAPDGGFDGDIYQYYYTSKEIIPEISLIYSGAKVESIKNEDLQLNKDYNITDGKTVREYINHGDNKDTITIRGTGNYIGVTTLDWRVIKLNFGEITSDKYKAVYDGEEHGINVNLTDAAKNADAEITYIYDETGTVYNADNWDESKATTTLPTFKDVLVDENNNTLTRTVYYRVHSENKDGGGSLIYNDFYGSNTVFITKKAVKLTAVDKTKVYDKNPATDPELTYEDYASQMIGNEVLKGIVMSRGEGQNAGIYKISFNLSEINKLNTNYTVTQTTGIFEITKRPVKVSVGDYQKIYSEVNPTLALTIEKDGDEGVAENEGLLAVDILTDESVLDTTLCFKDANDKIWKYDRFIDAGEYRIEKGTLANPNYDITFTNGSFTVEQKDISLEDTNVVMLYNGSRIDPVFTYTGKTITPKFTMSDEQDGVEYVNYEEDIDFEVKGVFKASDYGVFPVSIRGIHNYKGEIRGHWAILPVVDDTVDYDGNEHSLTFNLGASLTDGTALGIKFSETEPVSVEDYTLTECPSYVDAGVYNVYYGIIQNPEEYGEEGVFAGIATLTINKVDMAEIALENVPTAKENLVYNTQEQELVTAPEALPEGCEKIQYSIDSGKTWTDKAIATVVGNYTVKVKYVGDKNHFDKDGEDIAVSIAVADIEPTVEIEGWTYGQEANEPIVSGNLDNAQVTITYAVKGSEEFVETVPVNAGEYTVKAEIDATDNANGGVATADFKIEKISITVTAEDKTIERDADFEELTYTVDGKVIDGDDLGIEITSEATASVPGEYDIVVTCANENYEATLVNGKYTVTDRVSPKEKAKAKVKINSNTKCSPNKDGSINAKWGAVADAEKYEIYANYCSAKKYKKVKTLKGDVTSYKLTKLNGKKIDSKKNVKMYVVSYRKVDGNYVKIASTYSLHIAGKNHKTMTNAKGIKVNKSSFTLATGKTATIKSKLVLENSKKKAVDHVAKFRYLSTNTEVATVSEKGKITAVGVGTCKIYIFANNGKLKSVKVTVK